MARTWRSGAVTSVELLAQAAIAAGKYAQDFLVSVRKEEGRL